VVSVVLNPPGSNERLLLREVNHRIRNEIASAINVVAVAAVRSESSDVKSALNNVVELLHKHADVHCALGMPDHDRLVDAAENLRKLGLAISRSRLDRMQIKLVFAADVMPLEADRCWRLRLAVNELITNAVRHACFGGRDGEIRIELAPSGSFVRCAVSDNGAGAAKVKPVRGLRIVGDLARSLGGRIAHHSGTEGASFALVFPFTQRELQANKAAGARRNRPARRLKAIREKVVSAGPGLAKRVSRGDDIMAELFGRAGRSELKNAPGHR